MISRALAETALLVAGLVTHVLPDALPARTGAAQAVEIRSGNLRLAGLVWRPAGEGLFPAVLFNHGSGPTDPSRAGLLGPVFARHGYVFLYLFRRGDGLSASQGIFMGDLLSREGAAKGDEARRQLQLTLLTTDQLDDCMAGIAFLKRMPGVDPARVAVAGHSFGGQLAILAAERDGTLAAAVGFAPAAASWNASPQLRERLLAALRRGRVPLLLVYATNDYSTEPGKAMAAELARLGKTAQLKIYPAVGDTPDEGHQAVYNAIAQWEDDVFGFLDRHVLRQ